MEPVITESLIMAAINEKQHAGAATITPPLLPSHVGMCAGFVWLLG